MTSPARHKPHDGDCNEGCMANGPVEAAVLRRAAQSGPQTRNDRGDWVPAIPLPFYGLRKHCECGRKFWTAVGYRGHFALAHILFLP